MSEVGIVSSVLIVWKMCVCSNTVDILENNFGIMWILCLLAWCGPQEKPGEGRVLHPGERGCVGIMKYPHLKNGPYSATFIWRYNSPCNFRLTFLPPLNANTTFSTPIPTSKHQVFCKVKRNSHYSIYHLSFLII